MGGGDGVGETCLIQKLDLLPTFSSPPSFSKCVVWNRVEVYLSHYTTSHSGNRKAPTGRKQSYNYTVFHTRYQIQRHFWSVRKTEQKWNIHFIFLLCTKQLLRLLLNMVKVLNNEVMREPKAQTGWSPTRVVFKAAWNKQPIRRILIHSKEPKEKSQRCKNTLNTAVHFMVDNGNSVIPNSYLNTLKSPCDVWVIITEPSLNHHHQP